MGEAQVQVVGLDADPLGFEQGGEGPQLNGGVLARAEGHVDQRHTRAVTHRTLASPLRNAAKVRLHPLLESSQGGTGAIGVGARRAVPLRVLAPTWIRRGSARTGSPSRLLPHR